MEMTASSIYGGAPSPQPTATPVPTHAPGTPEPMAKTVATPTKGLSLGNPTLLLVVLAGIAFGLIQFSVRIGGK